MHQRLRPLFVASLLLMVFGTVQPVAAQSYWSGGPVRYTTVARESEGEPIVGPGADSGEANYQSIGLITTVGYLQ